MFAANCLLSRRLAERDVRFVQFYHRGWDHHGQLPKRLPVSARDTDQPPSRSAQRASSRVLGWAWQASETGLDQRSGAPARVSLWERNPNS